MLGVNELKEIAIKCGTPSYIFDTDELCARIDAMQQILGCGVTVCYAMKANPFLISVLDKKLDKFEVCSPGEFAICEKEGINREKIVLSGVNKEKKDISGPFDISVAVSDSSGGRMIVTGCTNMLLQDIDQAVSGANTDFVLNGVNYLAEQKSKISIRAKSLKTENAVVPAFNQKATLIMTVFVIPLIILAIGIGIVIKRRKL